MVVNYKPDEGTMGPDAYRIKCSERVKSTIEFYHSPQFAGHVIATFFFAT